MLRDECVVSHVKSYLNDNELNRVKKRRKTTMCLDCGDRKNVTNRLRFKVRKMLNLLVFLEPSFVNTVWKMTNQKIKHFCHMFLNYIIDNQDFSSYFFWVRLIVAPCTQLSVYLYLFKIFFCFNQPWFSSITIVIFFRFLINSSLIFLYCEAPENGSTDDLMMCSFSVELHCTYILCTVK